MGREKPWLRKWVTTSYQSLASGWKDPRWAESLRGLSDVPTSRWSLSAVESLDEEALMETKINTQFRVRGICFHNTEIHGTWVRIVSAW